MLAATVVLATLVVVVVALLAVPVVLAIDAERADRWRTRWQVQWLFGLVHARSRDSSSATPAAAAPARASPATPSPAPSPPATGRGPRRRVAMAVVRTHGLIPRVVRLSADLLRQVSIDRFRLHAAFGFDDPADTGIVYGWLTPLLVLAGVRGLDVQCRPMFQEAGLTGNLNATLRVRPLSLVAMVLRFIASRPVRRAAVGAWRART